MAAEGVHLYTAVYILCSEEYAALSPEKREIVDREIARLAAK